MEGKLPIAIQWWVKNWSWTILWKGNAASFVEIDNNKKKTMPNG